VPYTKCFKRAGMHNVCNVLIFDCNFQEALPV